MTLCTCGMEVPWPRLRRHKLSYHHRRRLGPPCSLCGKRGAAHECRGGRGANITVRVVARGLGGTKGPRTRCPSCGLVVAVLHRHIESQEHRNRLGKFCPTCGIKNGAHECGEVIMATSRQLDRAGVPRVFVRCETCQRVLRIHRGSALPPHGDLRCSVRGATVPGVVTAKHGEEPR